MKCDELIDFDHIVKSIETLFSVHDAENVELIIDTDGIKNFKIKSNLVFLNQIILNLVSNSCKFTKSG